jgi:hypothetical protein
MTVTITAFERSPDGGNARAHAITWVFASLNTVEPWGG